MVAVMVSASLIYIGGMILNDAFDADFDRSPSSGFGKPAGR